MKRRIPRYVPLIPCRVMPADPTPLQEVEAFLLSKRQYVKHDWLKEEIDRWLEELRKR